jgi:hypothetical protein
MMTTPTERNQGWWLIESAAKNHHDFSYRLIDGMSRRTQENNRAPTGGITYFDRLDSGDRFEANCHGLIVVGEYYKGDVVVVHSVIVSHKDL